MSGDNQKTRERKSAAGASVASRLLRFVPLPLGLMACLCAVWAWQAFIAPLEISELLTTQTLEQEITFDYSATPRVSTLYPTATLLGRQPAYLVNLIDSFQIHIQGKIGAPSDMIVQGTYQVVMRQESGQLWSKDYLLVPEEAFTGRDSFTAFDLTLQIPLRELLAFGARVGDEAAIGQNTYKLTILPMISVATTTEIDAAPLQNNFTPSFAFDLSGQVLTPTGLPKERYAEQFDPAEDLKQTNRVSRPIMHSVPNQFHRFGVEMTLPTAKFLFSSLAVIFGYLAIVILVKQQRQKLQPTEAESIRRRYGNKLIEVRYGVLAQGTQQLQLHNFQSLVRIADEREKPILYATNIDGDLAGHLYYLIDDGTTYTYFIPAGTED